MILHGLENYHFKDQVFFQVKVHNAAIFPKLYNQYKLHIHIGNSSRDLVTVNKH